MHNDPLIGRQLASFRVERLLGQGGMAHVYYGHDTKLDRPVAIKVIHPRYRDNASHTQRFVREAQAVAAWRHEHIIQIYYADDHDGLSYFVMEYIDGQDLSGLLSDYKRDAQLLPHADVLRIGRAVASALDYAHARGVIHRDVKPSNVFVARDGRVVLGDFGLALDLQEGTIGEVFGTPHYISPEQAHRSSNAVAQSDLYSLGIILYEMLTGGVPFDDASPTSVAVQHVTKAPPPPRTLNPGLSQATEQVLLKALSKEPGERYQSGAALIEALEVSLRAPAQAAPAQAASAQSGTDKIPTANLAATAPPAATAAQAAQPQRPPGSRSAKPLALGGVVAVLAIIAAIKLFAGAAAETDGSLPATAAATAASAAQQATQPRLSSQPAPHNRRPSRRRRRQPAPHNRRPSRRLSSPRQQRPRRPQPPSRPATSALCSTMTSIPSIWSITPAARSRMSAPLPLSASATTARRSTASPALSGPTVY